MPRFVSPILLLAASATMLGGCDGMLGSGGDRERQGSDRATAAAAQGRADARLPQGFTLIEGSGGIRDLSVAEAEGGGKNVAFATIVPPRDAIAFYEAQGSALGMIVAGRMTASDMIALNMQRETGSPRRFSVTASQKGEFTNISLMFDIGGTQPAAR